MTLLFKSLKQNSEILSVSKILLMGLFILKICFFIEVTRHMLQIVFSKDDSNDISHPIYSYSDVPLIKWWDLCLLFLHLSRPLWLSRLIEYDGSDAMWLSKLVDKNAVHFCFTVLGHLLLVPSHHAMRKHNYPTWRDHMKRLCIGIPGNSQAEISAEHWHPSLTSITCQYQSFQMISPLSHWMTLNLWYFIVE